MGKEEERKRIIDQEKLKLKPEEQIEIDIKQREKEITEIKDFLDQRSDRFIKVLAEVKHKLKMYQQSSAGKAAIYRVTSRGDFQGGNEIKEVQSIYTKILDGKVRKNRASNPDYSVKDVNDIIGTRVVCIYPSDVKTVANHIRRCRDFEIVDEEEKKERGYIAHHFTVSLAGRPELSGIVCEIQIRTMLLEAWYFKTHGLTYKGEDGEFFQSEHGRQAELISQSLAAIDGQSEVLKDQIMRMKEIERKTREIARRRFLDTLVQDNKGRKSSPTEDIGKILEFIQKKEKKIFEGDYGTVESIMYQITVYKEKNGIDLNLVRILALLAVTSKTDEFDGQCLDGIDELIRLSKGKPENLADIYLLKANICYCFNKMEDAYKSSKSALQYATEQNDNNMILFSKANIAYFIAELCDREREMEARKYSLEALKGRPMDSSFLDTVGFIKIVFDEDYDEVRKGLEYCEKAYEEAPESEKEIGRIYLQIHRLIATAHLLRLTQREIG